MAFASITYTSASGTTFALTNSDGNAIEYLRQSDISVTVNGTLQTLTTDYTFNAAGTSIVLNSAVSGATVVLARTTSITDATVSFTAGSTLTAQDLNNSDRQNRFALQEFSDIYDSLRTGTGDLGDLGGFIDAGETWVSDAAHAATTDAIDARVDSKIDSALTGDVAAGNAITITDNSPASGQITIAVTDGAIDTAELANNAVTTAKITDSNVTTAKINDSAVTTAKINDAAVTTAKLANDSVTSAKIADGTIIAGDIANNAVTTAKILDANVTTAKIADSNVTTAKINDAAVTEAKIAGSAVTSGKIASGSIDSTKLSGATVVTNAEHSGSTPNDTSFFTTSASDARYFRQDSSETIDSGDTWSGSDSFIATTAAIDARIIDLVDDVGGFVPIANETSFPATNPDINNPDGTGTIISVAEIATSRTPSSGTVTIANGSGSNTVTINGCGTTVLAAGFGVLVETTSTLHTYTFHRLVPKATEVTTVAGISSNITTVANNVSDITTVANDLNEATSEIETVANSISNVDAVGGSIANVNTVATNIASVNSFANVYRIESDDPTTSLDVGDLVFNTSNNKLRVYNGSSWQDGVTATGDLVSKTGDTMTGALGITSGSAGSPSLFISGDANTGIYSPGADQVAISTGGSGRLFVDSSGNVGVGVSDMSSYDSGSDDFVVGRSGNAGITIKAGTSSFSRLQFADGTGASTYRGFVMYSHTDDDMRLGTAGGERVRITSDGKVGVGTSNPLTSLHVYSAASTADSTRYNLLLQDSTSYAQGVGGGINFGFKYDSTGNLINRAAGIAGIKENGTDGNYAGALTFHTTQNSASTGERMRIDSSGRVGIGTTSPGVTLEVDGGNSGFTGEGAIRLRSDGGGSTNGSVCDITSVGTGTNDSALAFSTRSNAGGITEKARIDSSGRLLVGTSSTSNTYTSILVQGNASGTNTEGLLRLATENSTPGNGAGLGGVLFCASNHGDTAAIRAFRDGGTWTNDSSEPTRLVFSTTADGASTTTERMRIDSSGNVGIGTSSAQERLHVADNDSGAAGLFIHNQNGATNSSADLWFGNWSNATTASTYGARLQAINKNVNTAATDLAFWIYNGSSASERMRIDNSGRLLVGTTNARGDFAGTTVAPHFQIEGTGYDSSSLSLVRNVNSGGNGEIILGKTRSASNGGVTIVSNGDTLGGIRFDGADGSDFATAALITASVDGTPGANDMPGRLVFSTNSGTAGPTERMRITRNGNVFVNATTNPALGTEMFGVAAQSSGQITAAGFANSVNTAPTLFISNSSNTTNTYHVRFASGSGGTTRGEIYYNGSQLVYATSSDYRLKENVEPLSSGVDLVKQLRPVSYRWIESQQEDIGFIAHEVQEVFPNAVGGDKDAVDENGAILPQTYDPSKLVPLLTAALQEAIAKIETLEQRLNDAGIA